MTNDTISRMREFWPPPSSASLDRVRDVDVDELSRILENFELTDASVQEIVDHWRDVQRNPHWASLLAAGSTMVTIDRGKIDAPLPIWPDLNNEGDGGRLFYFYLFALCYDETVAFLRQSGTPEDIIDASVGILTRHSATYERKWGRLGVETGWWILLVLRGELLQIGALEFHRVTLGVGTLSPEWYDDNEARAFGPGFRRGDPSVGLHISQDADLSPASLDRTFEEAREVLGELWPVRQRRLATCRSWTMDERLIDVLRPTSNLVAFQRRFEIVPGSLDGDKDVLDFVFRRPNTALADLPQTTSLERAVVSVLQSGDHWRTRTGWLDFDGEK
jgi:hypothetical protein